MKSTVLQILVFAISTALVLSLEAEKRDGESEDDYDYGNYEDIAGNLSRFLH